MNTDERMGKLERDNKRLKRYVAVSISLVLAALIGGDGVGGSRCKSQGEVFYSR